MSVGNSSLCNLMHSCFPAFFSSVGNFDYCYCGFKLPWLLIPCVILLVLFVGVRWYYLKAARDLKRLEGLGNIIGNHNYYSSPRNLL